MKIALFTLALCLIVVRPSTNLIYTIKNPSSRMLSPQNQYRQLLANGEEFTHPGASNMQTLQWSNELEQKATNLTNQCPIQPTFTFTDSNGTLFGKNQDYNFQSSKVNNPDNLDIAEPIRNWYRGVEQINSKTTQNYKPDGGQQYTQMVWADTNQVGCGVSICQNNDRFVYIGNNQFLDYSTKGNILGSPIYKTGAKCSDSGCQCNSQWDALCDRSGNPSTPTNTSSNDTKLSKIVLCGMTDVLRQQALDAHNEYRQLIASGQQAGFPPASNMRVLKYSLELEKYANEWAAQCKFFHPEDREKRASYGQNAKYIGDQYQPHQYTTKYIKNAVDSWYGEHPRYPGTLISESKFIWGTGHFLGVIFADSYEVGCGMATCRRSTSNPFETYVVCNYRKPLSLGGKIYQEGKGCQSCQSSCNSKFNALCGQPQSYNVTSDPGSCGFHEPIYQS